MLLRTCYLKDVSPQIDGFQKYALANVRKCNLEDVTPPNEHFRA